MIYRDILGVSVDAAGPIGAKKCVTFAGFQATLDQPVYGVAQTDATLGRAVWLIAIGIDTLTAGGAIAAGDKLCSDANGDVIAKADAVNPIGRAITSAVAGKPVRVLLGRA